jgi:hypothetical protein
MGSMGTLKVGTGHGGASGLYDAQTPAAYEEVDDGGATASSANAIGNFLDNNAIMYTAPTLEFEGTTVTFTRSILQKRMMYQLLMVQIVQLLQHGEVVNR